MHVPNFREMLKRSKNDRWLYEEVQLTRAALDAIQAELAVLKQLVSIRKTPEPAAEANESTVTMQPSKKKATKSKKVTK